MGEPPSAWFPLEEPERPPFDPLSGVIAPWPAGRVDVWVIPAGAGSDLWQLMYGVRVYGPTGGTYTEHPSPGYPLTADQALNVLRRLHGHVDPGGATVSLYLDPEPLEP